MARAQIKGRAQPDTAMGRAGNYVAPVDTSGMDPEMLADLTATKLSKTESSYLSGTGGRQSAFEAIRRARRANGQPSPIFP